MPPPAAPTFEDEARRKLEELKGGGEIAAFRIESVDENAKTATAFVYVETAEGLKEERRLLVKKDDKIEVKKIV